MVSEKSKPVPVVSIDIQNLLSRLGINSISEYLEELIYRYSLHNE